VSSHNVLVVIV